MRISNAVCTIKSNNYTISCVISFVAVISFLIIVEGNNYDRHIGLKATSANTDDIGNGSKVDSENARQLDRFGVKKIYETKSGGREWYVNMDDPYTDPWFILGDVELEKQQDGSWRLGGINISQQFNDKYHILLEVITPPSQEEWRDVEITGYARIIAASEDEDEVGLQWYARGGHHTDEAPCEGTSLKGRLLVDGTANWKKEIWHSGGYTDSSETMQATSQPLIGRWIGWKVIMYNIENNTAVKMESYIDNENNNTWSQVTDLIDDGGWFAASWDEEFYSADCGIAKDHIITNSGPVASFRSDGIVWDFRDLSIREIQPPLPDK